MEENKKNKPAATNRPPWGIATWLWILVIGFLVYRLFLSSGNIEELSYDQFRDSLSMDRIDHVILSDKVIKGTFRRQTVKSDSTRTDSLSKIQGLLPLLGQKESVNRNSR